MSRVFVPLAAGPYTDFLRGAKSVEVRSSGSPVAAQVRKARAGAEVALRWGYGPHGARGVVELKGRLGRVWEGAADGMPDWVKAGACLSQESWSGRFFDPAGSVLCFEVVLWPPGYEDPDSATRVCQGCGEVGYVGPCRDVPGKRHGGVGVGRRD